MIGKMALEAESRSVSGVTDFLTEDFQGDGRVFGGNKQSLTRGIQTIFLRRGKIFVLPFLEYVTLTSEWKMERFWWLSRISRSSGKN